MCIVHNKQKHLNFFPTLVWDATEYVEMLGLRAVNDTTEGLVNIKIKL